MFGGNSNDASYNCVHVLDTETWEWTTPITVGASPAVRTGHQAIRYDSNHMLVYGGWDYHDEEEVVIHDDVFMLNIQSWEWHQLSVRGLGLGPRVGCSVVALESRSGDTIACVFGGQGNDSKYHDDLSYFNPDWTATTTD